MRMKTLKSCPWFGTLAFLIAIVIIWPPSGQSGGTGKLSRRRALSAPTFYLALKQGRCSDSAVELRGASNLPIGAILDLRLADFQGDGWTFYGDAQKAELDADGYFVAKIPLAKDRTLPHNLIATVTFGTNYHKQPANVVRMVGAHGENLDDLNNPQALSLSGFNTVLFAISRAPCGAP